MKKILKKYLPAVICGAMLILVLLVRLPVDTAQPSHTEETVTSGWQTINGQLYYYDDSGTACKGWQTIDESRFFFRPNGTLATGWFRLDGACYYLTTSGAAVGPTVIDGEAYIFDDQGRLGNGLTQVQGTNYLTDAAGHPTSGWQDGMYFDEQGCMAVGWTTIGSFLHYFRQDGSPAAGELQIDGKDYYFAENGQWIPFVNPWHAIDPDYTVKLVSINANHQIAAIAYEDFEAMFAACQAAGLDPAVCSSYRTQEYQQTLFDRKVEYYKKKGRSQEEAQTLAAQSVAYPGTSEHQLGLALDIIDNSNWNLNESQAKTKTQKWLIEHSWEYGWILRYPDGKSDITGIIFEPWHYRYVGRDVAARIHELDMCLEEYLDYLAPGVG